ncbi:MAG TPA: Na+/H+ antiporter NhaA [Actinomycetota bacterium]|nr:Na+/H+ antiporter NhaA [Actinomycetota bacterium]
MPRADRTNERPGPRGRRVRDAGPIRRRFVQPIQAFLQEESSSGVLLLASALVALAWSNSPWGASYERLWRTELAVRLGGWGITEDLRHWVNDALMSLFFLVVGLEIKRELVTGELRDPRAAALPAIAAVGGMAVPALVYLALNPGGEAARGWGIPMATDIAFAVGVLTLAARVAPPSLKPFLLTLAIVDDIGAIVAIAVFYSDGVRWAPLLAAAGLCALLAAAWRAGMRSGPFYVGLGGLLWLAVHASGVHPTIAGVAMGLLTPAVALERPRAVSREAHRVANATSDEPWPPDVDAPQWLELARLAREAASPLARLEAALHPWTSSVVVPLFALANAGVPLSADGLAAALSSRVTLGVLLGLVVGKTVGISLATLAAVRLGIAGLPTGARRRDVVGTAAVAGIGFTVSLFVAELAFADRGLVDMAKVGILAASVGAGALGLAILSLPRARGADPGRREL